MSRDTSENPLEILLNDGAAGCNRDPSRRSYLYNCTSYSLPSPSSPSPPTITYSRKSPLRSSVVDRHRAPFFAATSIFVEYPISFT